MARPKPSKSHAQASRIPDSIYKGLALDAAQETQESRHERPLKRRRIGKDTAPSVATSDDAPVPLRQDDTLTLPVDLASLEPQEDKGLLDRLSGNFSSPGPSGDESDPAVENQQVVYDESASSAEDDELDWEHILSKDEVDAQDEDGNEKEIQDSSDRIRLDLDQTGKQDTQRASAQRLPSTVVEKRKRLHIHKIHICTLLAHVYICNDWCNDHRVQDILSRFLDARTRNFLNPKASLSQRDRTTQFIKGLEAASHAWRGVFVIDKRGLRRPVWPADERQLGFLAQQATGLECDRADFLRASAKHSGSRDEGAQLFCSLLRAVRVDARLVCSLQPLSFTSVAPAVTPKAIIEKPTIDLSSSAQGYETDHSTASVRSISPTPKPIRRFGRQAQGSSPKRDMGKAPATPKPMRGRDSHHPIFWVEAFNHSKQQWVPVDPFATRTVNRPAKLEPPASDSRNDMTYVIAFNSDGTAKDVTRRYAKAYNAKTRKNRVEATERGERWFRQVMKTFRPPTGRTDRDSIEDGELDGCEAKEPMPRNVQDFKGHPYYALERHLKRHEVIHPQREVGKLRTGKGENVEPVFRRRDVRLCQTADKWYRSGRELKAGEQPLKRVPARRKTRTTSHDEDAELDGDGTNALYVFDQTELYKPPACDNGLVPKNVYKNLDVYVPTMIPPGAVQVRSSDAIAAARILKIDFAEAVTGFRFKGRRGTAVTQGVVIAKDFRDAMEEIVEALRWQRAETDRVKRSSLALITWKRFLIGMRIRERIMTGKDASEAAGEAKSNTSDVDDSGSDFAPEDTEGGFVAEEGPVARPTRGTDRDITREKFQDDFATTINDDLGKKTREYWEPTVTSPWDVPGLLGPTALEGRNTDDALEATDALFEEPSGHGGGGFVPNDEAVPHGDELGPEQLSGPVAGHVEEDHEQSHHGESDQGELSDQLSSVVEAPHDANRTAEPQKEQEVVHVDPNADQVDSTSDADSIDKQSLLSQDPEDHDAEPDWLDDELGL
ncbi:MAG: hypothetical protein Q9162_002203 [Coniocarpon cinnabarinum]